MNQTDVSDKVLRLLAAVCGTDEVMDEPDLPLYEREVLDSMKTVELMLAFESEFGLHISPAEFERPMWATPQKIVHDIEQRSQA